MRSHSQIIDEAGGAAAVHQRLGLGPNRIHAIRSWKQRNSIPGEYWSAFAALGLTSLEELAAAVASNDVSAPDHAATLNPSPAPVTRKDCEGFR